MQVRVENAIGVDGPGSYDPDFGCCPQCGWTPQTLVITEVIVGSREEVEALQSAGG
jgi:hypothetical protein